MAALVFWLCLGAVTAVYLIFPGVMAFLGRRPPAPVPPAALPGVTILIAAYNERDVIEAKLASCLNQEYLAEKLDVVLVSDGSVDDTVARARGIGSSRLEVVELRNNVGKAVALNAGMARARGEIVVLTDARQPLNDGAVRQLVAHFGDPEVGCVSGDLRYEREHEVGMQAALHRYWDYEKRIRLGEARIHSCVGATGALYAIRRDLWTDLPPGLLLDDVYTPMSVVLGGHRVLFEPSAWAVDVASDSEDHEYRRRVRTLTGNYQLLFELPEVLNPLKNPIWLQYVMHKIGRLVSPLLLLGMLVSSMLAPGWVYRWAFIAQAAFWLSAAGLSLGRLRLRFARVFSLPYAFAVTQGAALHALVHCLRRNWRVWGGRL